MIYSPNNDSAISGKRHFRYFIVVLIVILLSGCGGETLRWKEPVSLQSEETIVVSRTARFKANWIAGGGGGSINEGMTLEIVQPTGSENPGKWSDHFVPVLLDKDSETGEWFIVATFFHCDEWYQLGRPALPYTEYRFKDGRWMRQPLSEKWIGRETNVIPADLSVAQLIRQNGDIKMSEKNIFLSRPGIVEKFVRIVGSWKTNC